METKIRLDDYVSCSMLYFALKGKDKINIERFVKAFEEVQEISNNKQVEKYETKYITEFDSKDLLKEIDRVCEQGLFGIGFDRDYVKKYSKNVLFLGLKPSQANSIIKELGLKTYNFVMPLRTLYAYNQQENVNGDIPDNSVCFDL